MNKNPADAGFLYIVIFVINFKSGLSCPYDGAGKAKIGFVALKKHLVEQSRIFSKKSTCINFQISSIIII
jgi:hypothetical protein